MKLKLMVRYALCFLLFSAFAEPGFSQTRSFANVTASTNPNEASLAIDGKSSTGWKLGANDVRAEQSLLLPLVAPGDVNKVTLEVAGISLEELQKALNVYVTYDPMNLGPAVQYTATGGKNISLAFPPKYGAHVKLVLKGGVVSKPFEIREIGVGYAEKAAKAAVFEGEQKWRNPLLSVDERVESVLAAMTPADKMELIREGWGIPGIPHLGLPFLNKVESLHGYSYGSGATIFPQAIAMGATWDKGLVREIGEATGAEAVSANTLQGWSPVLDVAQDARWGRVEETYGEDPILVSQIGGAWIEGFQSKGVFATPKHFGGHGAPLGGRDSHDIGLSEREFREIHLVPFRHAFRDIGCQSVMMAYSDYQGVPVAKSRELLVNILREEWGFDGYIVSDCGALGNMTSRKHYTALDFIEAANQALAVGIATNCGDTYNNKDVLAAVKNGGINMENLDNTCRTLLAFIFRNGLFENNPSKSLDWNKIYDGWNTPEHKEIARRAARESIVLLENKDNILPLAKNTKTIAVIGPGADDLQPGDYTAKLQPGQLVSVLSGIRAAVDKSTSVIYEKGGQFTTLTAEDIQKAVDAAKRSDVAVLVLGDCSTSEGTSGVVKTSGEARDYATLELPGKQLELLKAVCETGTPVVLMLQAGRPYNLTYAAENCKAILVNWLPGQEGGYAAADVLFGDYNPAGRLPITFPRHVGQLPLYYNFKTSGRGYNYVDMKFTPLYDFGYGLSYTSFEYANLTAAQNPDGTVSVKVTVTNTGKRAGEEVVQLYVTDMYASVKTRVMELKDFNRISLKPGESKTVSFTLTPYQLSLLNDKMDRVVEAGEFKIMVGGSSPKYVAADKIKNSVSYENSSKGISTVLNYTKPHAAKFDFAVEGTTQNPLYSDRLDVIVNVKNSGDLTDMGKLDLYVDGQQNRTIHFELDPGQEKQIMFPIEKSKQNSDMTFVSKYKTFNYKK